MITSLRLHQFNLQRRLADAEKGVGVEGGGEGVCVWSINSINRRSGGGTEDSKDEGRREGKRREERERRGGALADDQCLGLIFAISEGVHF